MFLVLDRFDKQGATFDAKAVPVPVMDTSEMKLLECLNGLRLDSTSISALEIRESLRASK